MPIELAVMFAMYIGPKKKKKKTTEGLMLLSCSYLFAKNQRQILSIGGVGIESRHKANMKNVLYVKGIDQGNSYNDISLEANYRSICKIPNGISFKKLM